MLLNTLRKHFRGGFDKLHQLEKHLHNGYID